MHTLDLNPDELLTSTRAVRRRLDLSRPVEKNILEECVAIAQQAPTASNKQDWHFVIVTDSEKRSELARLYRKGAEAYFSRPNPVGSAHEGDSTQSRVRRSALFLVEHMQEVPVHVIPCIKGRTDGLVAPLQAAKWGSIFPAIWSFMLAARARGLGTTITSFHLAFEEEAAKALGIPYKEIMQAGLLPVAYSKGVDFKRAPREDPESIIHWNQW
ncbi:MAG: nitroreductase family protein [Nitrososphaerales archaeon]